MRFHTISTSIIALILSCLGAKASSAPAVLGKGAGLFEVGPELARDDFKDLKNWVLQIEPKENAPKARVTLKDGTLDCYLPNRGATIWFKEKLKTRVAITYDVICPSISPANKTFMPRDINNFWMAGDPEGKLFDSKRFTGEFGTYNKMHGYYASTGGGKNTTTRMRRYPREVNGKPADHLALNSRDNNPEFLITPDKTMRIQLVAYDDLIQYIVDGKLVYELAQGDQAQIETLDQDQKRTLRPAEYDLKRFPVYPEGYFGFRMVGSHHIYSNFRVHSLEPARQNLHVSSIDELRKAVKKSHQTIVMKAGTYVMPDRSDEGTGVHFSGSHNSIDLTGVTINTPIEILTKPPQDNRDRRSRRRRNSDVYLVSGDHVTIKGGRFDNPHPAHDGSPIDFGSYNQNSANYPRAATTEIRLTGDDIILSETHLTVRGSSPYGYGNIYGIGGGAVVPLRKHSGILMTGDRITLEKCFVKMEAFGHAIFVQGGDQITVRHCEVEGEVRPSNDLYKETNKGDLAKKFDYKMQWPDEIRGLPIPKDHMLNLVEDGIRAYGGTGHMTVENCKVTKTRGGIKLYMAKSAKVTDCEVRDTVVQGYSIPSRGSILRSRGNAAYGPLLYIHGDSHSSQKIDLEILPAPHSLGDHPLAALKGRRHDIRLRSSKTTPSPRPIIVGYPMRFDYLSQDFPEVPKGYEAHFKKFAPDDFRAEEITLFNATGHPVVLGKHSKNNRISSAGKVRDLGTGNKVTPLPPSGD